MRLLVAICLALLLSSCQLIESVTGKGHTVKVKKPIYHHGYYKDSRWHRKLQVGRIRLRLFEKQGAKTVRMRG
jgi:hypothetical protein